jgi:hypothetical protein
VLACSGGIYSQPLRTLAAQLATGTTGSVDRPTLPMAH